MRLRNSGEIFLDKITHYNIIHNQGFFWGGGPFINIHHNM